jgi:hypothetical protein
MKHTPRVLSALSLFLILLSAITSASAQKRVSRAQANASRKARANAAGPVFGAAQSYAAGFGGASQSVAADFNGDGIPDIAVVNPCSSSNCGSGYASVAILMGNGDGSFQAPAIYPTGSYEPMSLAAGDFNGDGVPDLVVASQCTFTCGSGQVSILLGNGDGTFQAAVPFPAGTGSSYFVATGDFNGDGNLDLAVAEQTGASSDVVILLGNGNGTFQAPAGYSTGATSAASLALGDFNRDGVPDLAVANGAADSVSILLGNGDGTFQTALIYASGGTFANSVAVGDFNGDGAPDLAVVNGCASDTTAAGCSQSGSVAVLLGNGDGTFQLPVAYGSGGNSANFVTLADFDGDGNLDLAVSNLAQSAGGGAGVLGLLLGNGDGTFQPAATFGSGGSLAVSVSAGYFNGAGQPGLAVVNQCPASGSCTNSVVGVLLNTASPFQSTASSTVLISSVNPAAPGQSVSLTATVTPAFNNGAPTGSITFYDGPTALSTVAISNGQAAYTAAFAAPGRQALHAVYSGDANYAASSSAVLSETVGTPMTLTSSLNPSPLNQAVTFTATVAGSGGTPTGSVTFMDGANSLGTLSLVNGSVPLSQSALAAGNHAITASYSGDANFQPGLATLTQAVSQATTTALASSANPANVNQSIAFTATVTGQDGSAAPGAVAFLQGSPPAIWGTAPLVNGQASIANTFSSANTYPVTAVYLGSPDYQTSTSAVLNQVVNANQSVTTTTALASSGTPSFVGQPVKFTATISPASGAIPDGETVTFYDGTTSLGSAATSGAIAAFTTSALSAGSHSITAAYSGDGTYQSSTSHVFYQSVQLDPTNTTLASSLNPSTYGQAVTFTVAVAPQSGTGTPTGNVTIKNGATPIGSVTLNNGAGTLTTPALPAGSLSISASYTGDTSFATSSATVTQTVNVASTTTALTSTPNPSGLNQTVTFTATVTGQYGGTPGGTVTFTQGSTTLGSAAPTYGKAIITTAFSATGTYPVVATYSGDVSDGPSASAALNQVVNNISTTTSVTSSGTPSFAGQTVTFTATVTAVSGAIPDGEIVTFNDSAIPIGVGLTKSGAATLATAALAAGTHSITAVYAGDATYQTSTSKTFLQVVSHNASVTTVVPSANPSVYGQALTLTATVAPASGSGTPTGNVSFKNGSTAIGSVALVNGVAALTISALAAGSLPLTASYGGDASFSGSSAALTQVVSQSITTTTLTSNPNPASLSQTVTFTATVAAQYQGAITGSVSFMNGSTTLGSAPIAKNKATFTNAFSTAGTDSITAVYTGDANNQTSTSQALSQVVTNAPTTTTVASSGSPAFVGQPVTFTATVTSSYGAIPNGELVTFYSSGAAIGTGSTNGGIASMTISSLTSGTHSITATYAGDASFESSTSRAISQTISLNTTTTLLASNANPSAYGQPAAFTATVTSGGPAPTGTVTFKNGTTSLGVATLNAQGSATFTTLTLGAGVYSITVAYSGDTSSAKSTSAALNQTVTTAATTTQIVSSVNPSAPGESVGFTALVRSATTIATGSVTFTAGSTVLGTATIYNGSATLAVTTLPVGATNVTATYAGSANVAGSSASMVQNVQ